MNFSFVFAIICKFCCWNLWSNRTSVWRLTLVWLGSGLWLMFTLPLSPGSQCLCYHCRPLLATFWFLWLFPGESLWLEALCQFVPLLGLEILICKGCRVWQGKPLLHHHCCINLSRFVPQRCFPFPWNRDFPLRCSLSLYPLLSLCTAYFPLVM